MRRVILLLSALLLLGASAALAQGAFPKKIALPNAFAPEGIEVGNGNTVYVGSVGTGAVWVGDLRTGSGRILVAGAPERARCDRDRVRSRPALGLGRALRQRAASTTPGRAT